MSNTYLGKKVLITGGLGMIGSTLAHKLVNYGASVFLVDAFIEPFGANMFNIEEIKKSVEINISDIRDKESMKHLVKGQDVIFNLAGQVSHNDSMENPFLDADINYFGHLNVLECVRKNNPEAIVFHAGSRLQFGAIERIPVKEDHPLKPRTPYALNKTAAENMYQFYHEMHRIRCVCFRIANPYGPRSQMRHSKYSIINWFTRLAMDGQKISIFGPGDQIRDYIYVDDLAEAMLITAINPICHGEVFNVGTGVGTKFKEMVDLILAITGKGSVEYIPWPENYQNVETGDHITDISKISGLTGWKPQTNLETGIRALYDFYSKYRSFYW